LPIRNIFIHFNVSTLINVIFVIIGTSKKQSYADGKLSIVILFVALEQAITGIKILQTFKK